MLYNIIFHYNTNDIRRTFTLHLSEVCLGMLYIDTTLDLIQIQPSGG